MESLWRPISKRCHRSHDTAARPSTPCAKNAHSGRGELNRQAPDTAFRTHSPLAHEMQYNILILAILKLAIINGHRGRHVRAACAGVGERVQGFGTVPDRKVQVGRAGVDEIALLFRHWSFVIP